MANDLFHILKTHGKGRRGIGIREHDTAVLPVIVFFADGKIIF